VQDLSFKLQARDLELTRRLQYKKFLNPLEKSNLMRVAGVNDGKMCASDSRDGFGFTPDVDKVVPITHSIVIQNQRN